MADQARIDRIARSLRRLGFQLTNVGQGFKVTDRSGSLAVGSTPKMTLAEVEQWIGGYIKPKKTMDAQNDMEAHPCPRRA
jgi:hypothetical protein